jgi:REP element-mobilizing transposase RayT
MGSKMTRYNPDIHHRHSIRLRGYDYSQEGAYFITFCTQKQECLFGDIKDGKMVLNDAGRMIQSLCGMNYHNITQVLTLTHSW